MTVVFVSAGCDALIGLIGLVQGTQATTVELRNNSEYPVKVSVFFDDDQETIDGVIQETGTERNFVIPAGNTESFSRPCDDLQAVIVDDADLQIIGEIGPEDKSDLIRDGDDFGCGDTIIFTFDHSEILVDFRVSVTTVSP